MQNYEKVPYLRYNSICRSFEVLGYRYSDYMYWKHYTGDEDGIDNSITDIGNITKSPVQFITNF